MKRCVIVGGAPIRDYEEIRQQLRLGDYLIFCDSGLRHMEGLGCRPDLVVGVSGRLRGAPSPAAAQPPPPEGEARGLRKTKTPPGWVVFLFWSC